MEQYTATVMQTIHTCISHRREIKSNIRRYLELIDCVTFDGAASRKEFAPVKLVAFPEEFLQGFDRRWDLKKYLDDIVITIPGEETDILGEKAKEYGVYIVGSAYELDLNWKDRFFNTAFIIGPDGEVIHKYRKFVPSLAAGEICLSPHDMYDEYVARYGESLNTFFPVTDTPIGKIGTLICMDAHFPETARALAINGAEIIVRPTGFSGTVPLQLDYWELQNRSRAYENLVYVVAPNPGLLLDSRTPSTQAGHSMIVNYDGSILGVLPYPGEGFTSAIINLDILRKRRKDVTRNLPVQLKAEVYKLIYDKPIYPKNRCLKEPYKDIFDLSTRGSLAPIIEDFLEKGIYTKPESKG